MKDEKFTKDDITSILSAILQGEPQDFSRTVAVPIAVVEDAISALKDDSDRDKFAIEFKDWCDKLSFMDKVTVHPIAGSGGSSGPRELTNSELLETYLRKLFHSQKQT